jgi:hypothetical protein
MRKTWFTAAATAAVVGLAIVPPGNAQQPAAAHDHEVPPAAGATYRPGLGDLMTASVQSRHTKLGLAGAEQNWDYAAYSSRN